MGAKQTKEFRAAKLALWKIDGTPLTVITDAEIPLGQICKNIRLDIRAQDRLTVSLRVVHWSSSFEGLDGSCICGRGYKLHNPSKSGVDLWEGLRLASIADWTEVTPSWAKEAA